jgi:hypothetical protein
MTIESRPVNIENCIRYNYKGFESKYLIYGFKCLDENMISKFHSIAAGFTIVFYRPQKDNN